MKSKRNILIVVLIILVLSLTTYILYLINTLKKNCDVTIPQIENNGNIGNFSYNTNNKVLKIEEIITNFTASDGNKYAKFLVSFENKNDTDTKTDEYTFWLTNDNDEINGVCYNKAIPRGLTDDDMLSDTIKANATTKGYLYCCNSDLSNVAKLRVGYVTRAFYDENGYLDVDENVFNYDLKDIKITRAED